MTTRTHPRANVFTIAPDVPFLPTFAGALLGGRVVADVAPGCGPFALARTTVFVPTQRSRRALVAALAEAAGGATLLPRVAALGALDDEETVEDDPFFAGEAEIPPAIGELERRLLLTDMVLAWSRALRGAIVSADRVAGFACDPARTLLVGTSPADAFALAGELARLVDEFIIEGIDPRRLRDLAGAEHDRYWQITAQFLDIAFAQWPKVLAERGLIDGAERRVRLAAVEAARLSAKGSRDPVIVLGSTGTNEATARLMAAICRLPNGAVVLPGLDLAMPSAVFACVGRADGDPHEPAYGHAQTALKRLLGTLGISRDEVEELAPGGLSPRLQFVSAALRPAEATGDWPKIRAGFGEGLADAFAGVTLLAAADEREEALAIAVRLREVVETPGRTAALVTPDRTLARRVRNELRRWSVAIDDSAGEPLSATPPGVLARLVLAAAADGTDASLLAVLAHPLVRLGRERADVAHLSRLIEGAVFRANVVRKSDLSTRIALARTEAADRRAHGCARRVRPEEWDAIASLLADLGAALGPLRRLAAGTPLSAWIAVHRDAFLRIVGASDPPVDPVLDALFTDPALAQAGLRFDADEYRAMFDRLAASRIVPGPRDAHPRLKILGLLEARLLSADVVILGGLDETIWPPVARTDPFVNRPMRAQLGLTPPERRIGQTAHDLWMALGAPEVLLTRAKKRGGAPTTPSRFLQRFAALAGDALDAAVRRGDALARLARTLDAPGAHKPCARPQPRPPVALRPTGLSVTRVETWIRDPYAIYAERVLKLAPLGALDEAPGYAEQGTAIHAAVEWATRTFGIDPLPDDAEERLHAQADQLLNALHEDPSWRAFRRPRQMAGLSFFLDYHRERRPTLSSILVEANGVLGIPLDDGTTFRLTGTADRIEVARNGDIRVVDFKTGSPPSPKEIAANLAPQLTLEAAMVAAGAFPDLPARAVTEALYLRLGSKNGGENMPLQFKDRAFGDVVAHHMDLLRDLACAYRDPDRAFASRPVAKWATRYANYDHLARVKEWSETSGLGADDA